MNAASIGRLLVVDDEATQMKALCDVLTLEGYCPTGFSSATRALETLGQQQFDLLLTDLKMPEMDGISLLSEARKISPDIVAIVMTGHAAIDTAVKAMQAGALDYIVKPFKLNVILPVINRALSVRKLHLENKRLQQSVLERTRELETANRQLELVNRELESFSYSVSHDLRAPLRTVQGFCQIFMEDYGAAVPPEGLKTLEHVISGSRRMGQLIDDILALSQLGRKPLRRRSMCLSELTQRVVAELRARDSGRAVEVRIGDLGYCDGDVSLIEQVLVNLLSNAFKFTARSASAVIEVDCTPSEEGPVYCVRDNGAGFDMKYVDKLFGLFQRLHPASEFEGTGVGLSIVRRIIQRHGGRIWAQSEPGKGATFYFTIPAAAAAA